MPALWAATDQELQRLLLVAGVLPRGEAEVTDTEINRLVAETVMGFTKISEADPSYISDYCNDPAAWGALFGVAARA